MSLGAFLAGVVLRRFGAGALPIGSLLLVGLAAACFAGSRNFAQGERQGARV
jgi:predicted MFS family arabinose efflux permease